MGEYRVKQVVEGELKTQTVRVAHWALLDGAATDPGIAQARLVRPDHTSSPLRRILN